MIFISSVVGFTGAPGQINYAASKAGLLGVARSLTREIGSRNITANLITPGYIETDMTEGLPDEVKAAMLAATPAGRFGRPEDVAAAATFLASDAASFISGAVLPVDGGSGMGH
jgi:3-oxoacyl-[acyl-carrier protein] reductase